LKANQLVEEIAVATVQGSPKGEMAQGINGLIFSLLIALSGLANSGCSRLIRRSAAFSSS